MVIINRLIANSLPYFPPKFIWLFSKRYIAGENLEDAIDVSLKLNKEGIDSTIDVLGEFTSDARQIAVYKNHYLEAIKAANENQVNCSFSVKPTMFGLQTDKNLCYTSIMEIIKTAAKLQYSVTIDMEDSSCTEDEIELFRALQNKYPANTGFVFQAYMKRTWEDLHRLSDLNTEENPLNIRICKGIYNEPHSIAYKKHDEINKHYLEDLEFMLTNGFFSAIATHDEELVKGAMDLINKYKIPEYKYEFQMLYGVTPELCRNIIAEGHKMRIYVPYGKDWFRYSTRRLKENPKMASQIIKALFIRK